MLTFNGSKTKELIFELQIEGAEKEQLTFMFRLDIDGIEYGFKGEFFSESKVRFEIPPLTTIVRSYSITNGTARVDATRDQFIVHPPPWADKVIVNLQPNIEDVRVESDMDTGEMVQPLPQHVASIKVDAKKPKKNVSSGDEGCVKHRPSKKKKSRKQILEEMNVARDVLRFDTEDKPKEDVEERVFESSASNRKRMRNIIKSLSAGV